MAKIEKIVKTLNSPYVQAFINGQTLLGTGIATGIGVYKGVKFFSNDKKLPEEIPNAPNNSYGRKP